MVTIVDYYPNGIIDHALFNFDEISQITNFKLAGPVTVSVSDSFTVSDFVPLGISSNVYTSSSSGSVHWTSTQLANIQIFYESLPLL